MKLLHCSWLLLITSLLLPAAATARNESEVATALHDFSSAIQELAAAQPNSKDELFPLQDRANQSMQAALDAGASPAELLQQMDSVRNVTLPTDVFAALEPIYFWLKLKGAFALQVPPFEPKTAAAQLLRHNARLMADALQNNDATTPLFKSFVLSLYFALEQGVERQQLINTLRFQNFPSLSQGGELRDLIAELIERLGDPKSSDPEIKKEILELAFDPPSQGGFGLEPLAPLSSAVYQLARLAANSQSTPEQVMAAQNELRQAAEKSGANVDKSLFVALQLSSTFLFWQKHFQATPAIATFLLNLIDSFDYMNGWLANSLDPAVEKATRDLQRWTEIIIDQLSLTPPAQFASTMEDIERWLAMIQSKREGGIFERDLARALNEARKLPASNGSNPVSFQTAQALVEIIQGGLKQSLPISVLRKDAAMVISTPAFSPAEMATTPPDTPSPVLPGETFSGAVSPPIPDLPELRLELYNRLADLVSHSPFGIVLEGLDEEIALFNSECTQKYGSVPAELSDCCRSLLRHPISSFSPDQMRRFLYQVIVEKKSPVAVGAALANNGPHPSGSVLLQHVEAVHTAGNTLLEEMARGGPREELAPPLFEFMAAIDRALELPGILWRIASVVKGLHEEGKKNRTSFRGIEQFWLRLVEHLNDASPPARIQRFFIDYSCSFKEPYQPEHSLSPPPPLLAAARPPTRMSLFPLRPPPVRIERPNREQQPRRIDQRPLPRPISPLETVRIALEKRGKERSGRLPEDGEKLMRDLRALRERSERTGRELPRGK